MTREEFHVSVLRKVAEAGKTPGEVGRSLRKMNPDLCKQSLDLSTMLLAGVGLPALLWTALKGVPAYAQSGGEALGTALGSVGSVNPYNREASVKAVENLINTYGDATQDLRRQNELAQQEQKRRASDIAHLRR